jgi:predicted DNA binding protein
MTDIVERIDDALRHDTFWDTDAPPLLNDAVAEIKRLREAICRLANQDATLSVQGGSVTVTMDATLTDSEREAIADAVAELTPGPIAATLRSLLARLAVE